MGDERGFVPVMPIVDGYVGAGIVFSVSPAKTVRDDTIARTNLSRRGYRLD